MYIYLLYITEYDLKAKRIYMLYDFFLCHLSCAAFPIFRGVFQLLVFIFLFVIHCLSFNFHTFLLFRTIGYLLILHQVQEVLFYTQFVYFIYFLCSFSSCRGICLHPVLVALPCGSLLVFQVFWSRILGNCSDKSIL